MKTYRETYSHYRLSDFIIKRDRAGDYPEVLAHADNLDDAHDRLKDCRTMHPGAYVTAWDEERGYPVLLIDM